jgi:GH25 family lysozyme M1 (1,4-beta-N-acetylmuramidase)
MLYGSLIYLDNIWIGKDKRPIWLAQYADKPDYKGQYRIWQASDTGRIDGIDGDVDMDIMTND